MDGTPSTEVEKPPIETQDNSLPLKPPKKQHTPTPSQPSGDQSDPPVPVEQKERSANCEKPETAGTRERDALDDMIDETKAAKDLVSSKNGY